jgi:hypothetical protein
MFVLAGLALMAVVGAEAGSSCGGNTAAALVILGVCAMLLAGVNDSPLRAFAR